MQLVGYIIIFITAAIALGTFIASVVALVHASRQRADAFPAVDKLTKPTWVAILIGSVVLSIISSGSVFLGVLPIIAVSIYLVDVKPRVDEVQRGPRW